MQKTTACGMRASSGHKAVHGERRGRDVKSRVPCTTPAVCSLDLPQCIIFHECRRQSWPWVRTSPKAKKRNLSYTGGGL